jgi:adenylate cyclase
METSNPKQSLALLFCDIEGTTRLIAREGDLVGANLLRAFFENAGRLATEHHCAFMKFIGDAFLAAFDKADQVLPFALAVQNVTGSDAIIRDHHIGLRFSLHFGDVLRIETSYGKDILGEDINIVARLNDLAAPGEIVISGAAFQKLRLSVSQQALVGPSEKARIRNADEMQIHRFSLTAR